MDTLKRKAGYIIRRYDQLVEWINGESKHNHIDDECCPDFTCCTTIIADNPIAKKITYDFFMEQNGDKIRSYKIDKILK